jgi:hypothetical protein
MFFPLNMFGFHSLSIACDPIKSLFVGQVLAPFVGLSSCFIITKSKVFFFNLVGLEVLRPEGFLVCCEGRQPRLSFFLTLLVFFH